MIAGDEESLCLLSRLYRTARSGALRARLVYLNRDEVLAALLAGDRLPKVNATNLQRGPAIRTSGNEVGL
jgi:hypothetical protein